jgi:hypothetical protein
MFNALVVLALAVLFYVFFDVTKHDPALSSVNPFAEDPYDAIGSFGTQSAIFCALLALVRAFLARRGDARWTDSPLWLLRAQMASVLLVLVTMAGNAVALARHSSLWLGAEAGMRLLALLVGMTVLALALGLRIHLAARRLADTDRSQLGLRALVVCIVALLVLALYPEGVRDNLMGELFTVVVGALLLFLPTWALLTALVPEGETRDKAGAPSNVAWWRPGRRLQWALVVAVGLVLGMLVFLGEAIGEGFGSNLAKVAQLAAIFVGLEAAGVLIGFGVLRKPLGLFRAPAPA